MTTNKTTQTTDETSETTESKTRQKQATAALNAISAAIHGPRGEKRRQHEAEKQARRDERKAKLLAVLTSGETGRKDQVWNARMALTKATSAVKNGATAEELQACTALQGVAPWAQLVEPVEQFGAAKGADTAVLLAGLGCSNPETSIAAAEGSAAPVSEPEAPKAQPKSKKPGKGRQGRARRAS